MVLTVFFYKLTAHICHPGRKNLRKDFSADLMWEVSNTRDIEGSRGNKRHRTITAILLAVGDAFTLAIGNWNSCEVGMTIK